MSEEERFLSDTLLLIIGISCLIGTMILVVRGLWVIYIAKRYDRNMRLSRDRRRWRP